MAFTALARRPMLNTWVLKAVSCDQSEKMKTNKETVSLAKSRVEAQRETASVVQSKDDKIQLVDSNLIGTIVPVSRTT